MDKTNYKLIVDSKSVSNYIEKQLTHFLGQSNLGIKKSLTFVRDFIIK